MRRQLEVEVRVSKSSLMVRMEHSDSQAMKGQRCPCVKVCKRKKKVEAVKKDKSCMGHENKDSG